MNDLILQELQLISALLGALFVRIIALDQDCSPESRAVARRWASVVLALAIVPDLIVRASGLIESIAKFFS
jgi:hypothetical protein